MAGRRRPPHKRQQGAGSPDRRVGVGNTARQGKATARAEGDAVRGRTRPARACLRAAGHAGTGRGRGRGQGGRRALQAPVSEAMAEVAGAGEEELSGPHHGAVGSRQRARRRSGKSDEEGVEVAFRRRRGRGRGAPVRLPRRTATAERSSKRWRCGAGVEHVGRRGGDEEAGVRWGGGAGAGW